MYIVLGRLRGLVNPYNLGSKQFHCAADKRMLGSGGRLLPLL
jgi:hypothetical protein